MRMQRKRRMAAAPNAADRLDIQYSRSLVQLQPMQKPKIAEVGGLAGQLWLTQASNTRTVFQFRSCLPMNSTCLGAEL